MELFYLLLCTINNQFLSLCRDPKYMFFSFDYSDICRSQVEEQEQLFQGENLSFDSVLTSCLCSVLSSPIKISFSTFNHKLLV